jgi:hypothetical protein
MHNKKTGPRLRGPAFVSQLRPCEIQLRWKDQRWGLRERLQEHRHREPVRKCRHRNRKGQQLRIRKRELHNRRSERSNRCDERDGLRDGSSRSSIAGFRNRRERQQLRNRKEQERLRSKVRAHSKWARSSTCYDDCGTSQLRRP